MGRGGSSNRGSDWEYENILHLSEGGGDKASEYHLSQLLNFVNLITMM